MSGAPPSRRMVGLTPTAASRLRAFPRASLTRLTSSEREMKSSSCALRRRRDAVFVFYERDMMRQEPVIHELVRSKTNVPVARIYVHDDSHKLVDRDYLIMERLPGRPLTDSRRVCYDDVLRQVGQHLARVHRITAHEYGYLGPHSPCPAKELGRCI